MIPATLAGLLLGAVIAAHVACRYHCPHNHWYAAGRGVEPGRKRCTRCSADLGPAPDLPRGMYAGYP